jgi:NAD(P)-dependent dehydrogenase (short-subunit alcohol dehydrogenase family)
MSDGEGVGKVALITGASRGVGADTARLLAEAGFDVVVNYRSKARRAEQVADTVRAAGREALIAEADVTDATAVEAMFQKTEDTFGGLDVLVLNASGGLEKDVAPDYGMLLNRDSQVAMARAALPIMRRGGRIVFVTSHLAHFFGEKPGVPEYDVVAESKHAGEQELRKLIPDFTEAGISFVVVSGDLLDGSITPKLLDRVRPGVISSRREEAGTLPTVLDFATAVAKAAEDTSLATGDTVFVGSTEWSAAGFNSGE